MVLVFLADGFEESEAILPIDILRRAGLDVVTVAIGEDRNVSGSHGLTLRADVTAETLPDCTPEMVFLPGGMPGTKNLDASPVVKTYLEKAYTEGSFMAAICAAPMVLGRQGLLQGKNATCYPGFEQYLAGATVGGDVVADGKVITGKGMGVALPFALKLVEALRGKEAAEAIADAVCYPG